MGARIPGSMSGLIDPQVVESLIELEKLPVETAKRRREQYVEERDEISKLGDLVNNLDTALKSLKSRTDFYKMKVESSHPDIIDGIVSGTAITGSYEFEVRGLARAEKELAFGFPDKDKADVGFGYMLIEREDMEDAEIVIEPGSCLQDVANSINDASLGVKAMIINTKYEPDPYRLLVISEKSGKESKIYIDEDTTFMEFKEQVTGRNLDVLFEDVPVTDNDNNLEELVDGIVFNVKRSEPGTRVQVSIVNDVDATLEGIKTFVDGYNEIIDFIHKQFQKDPQTNKAGILSGDSAVRAVQRNLQSTIGNSINAKNKYSTLGEIGITTDPKTGSLNLDETKVRGALAEDYDSVAALFVRTKDSEGVAERLSERIRGLRDPQFGVLNSRVKGINSIIKNQDDLIDRKERTMEKREQSIRQRFTSLESNLAGMKAQGDFLSSRFGGGGPSG